jgi:hypothetical protein
MSHQQFAFENAAKAKNKSNSILFLNFAWMGLLVKIPLIDRILLKVINNLLD